MLTLIIEPFLFIKNKQLFISSKGYSVLEKRRDMFSEGNAAHPVRCDSILQIGMAVLQTFLNLNFLGWV
jgi:hypothetical protein